MIKMDFYEWSTFSYRLYKSCDSHWRKLGRPCEISPPQPEPLSRYLELSDQEKIQRLINLLEWAKTHEVPLKL